MNKKNTKFLVTTALFIALSVILKTLGISITGGGIVTMKINFSAIFYILPGLLFGPFYGAVAGGASDVVGYLVKPTGAYIPILTLTNIIAGILPSLLWKRIKFTSPRSLKKLYMCFFSLILFLGTINYVIMRFMYTLPLGRILGTLGKKAQYAGIGFILIGIIGIAVFIINEFIEKSLKNSYTYLCNNFFKLIISVGISGVIVSTLDTCVLLILTPALASHGFIVLWLPRIVQTLIMTIINSYLLSMLIYLYEFADKKSLSRT